MQLKKWYSRGQLKLDRNRPVRNEKFIPLLHQSADCEGIEKRRSYYMHAQKPSRRRKASLRPCSAKGIDLPALIRYMTEPGASFVLSWERERERESIEQTALRPPSQSQRYSKKPPNGPLPASVLRPSVWPASTTRSSPSSPFLFPLFAFFAFWVPPPPPNLN